MDSNTEIFIMLLGVVLYVGETWIVKQVRKFSKRNLVSANFVIQFSAAGTTLAGVASTLVQGHVNAYSFFLIYPLVFGVFIIRSYGQFKKLRAKVAKVWFIIHFTIGSYFIGALGIYMFIMAPFANMMNGFA